MTPALATFILGVSVRAMQRGDPPCWFGCAGLLVTAVQLVNTWLGMGSPVVLGFLWVLALAVMLAVRSPTTEDSPSGSGAAVST